VKLVLLYKKEVSFLFVSFLVRPKGRTTGVRRRSAPQSTSASAQGNWGAVAPRFRPQQAFR